MTFKIVHADDRESIRTSAKMWYETKFPDAELHLAENGTIAYQLVNQHNPDVLVTDFDFGDPQMHGGNLVEKVRGEGFGGLIISFNGDSKDFEPWRNKINHSIEKPSIKAVIELIEQAYSEKK